MDQSQLCVVTCISNPVRYKSRYELYQKFARHMNDSGVHLFTVEQAFGTRPFEITSPDNPMHLQLRSSDELWHKENMLNLAMQRTKAPYIAWVDADIHFLRPDWAAETIQQLQHHAVVQMWEHVHNLGPQGQTIRSDISFARCLLDGTAKSPYWNQYGGPYPHTGFAWAARREILDQLGGLLSTAILGAGDHHMAWGLLGMAEKTCHAKIHPNYKRDVMNWQARALRAVRHDVGCVPGTIIHGWHGKRADRKYVERWQILIDSQFDPSSDIVQDTTGLWRLVDDGSSRILSLRDGIRQYFRQRNEDSVDV